MLCIKIRKGLSICLAVVMVATMLASGSVFAGAKSEETLLYDDFGSFSVSEENSTHILPNWTYRRQHNGYTVDSGRIWTTVLDSAHGRSAEVKMLDGDGLNETNGNKRTSGQWQSATIDLSDKKPIRISYEFYVRAWNGGGHHIGAFLYRAENTRTARLGLVFENDGSVYERYYTNGTVSKLAITKYFDGTDVTKAIQGVWHQVDYVYYPETAKVDYYLDGKKLAATGLASTEGIEDKTSVAITFQSGIGMSGVSAGLIDNIEVIELEDISKSDVVVNKIENGEDTFELEWIDTTSSKWSYEGIVVEKFEVDDYLMLNGTEIYDYELSNKRQRGITVKFDNKLTTAGEKYRITLPEMTDIFGVNHNYVFEYTVGDTVVKENVWTDDFEDYEGGADGKTRPSGYSIWQGSADGTKRTVNAETVNAGTADENTYLKLVADDDKNSGGKEAWLSLKRDTGIDTSDSKLDHIDITVDVNHTSVRASQAPWVLISKTRPAGDYIIARRLGIAPRQNMLRYVTAHDTSYDGITIDDSSKTLEWGQWYTYRMRYFPKTGLYNVYTVAADGTETLLVKDIKDNNANCYSEEENEFGYVVLAIYADICTAYFDNVSVDKYMSSLGTGIDAIRFGDINGNIMTSKGGTIPAGAKYIYIAMNAVDAVEDGDIVLTKDGVDVGYQGHYANGVYTMTLDKVLVGDSEYAISVNNILDEDYADTFITGAGEFVLSNLRFTDGTNDITGTALPTGTVYAAVDAMNSLKDETPVLIWAAYKGGVLEYVDFQELDIEAGSADTYQAIDGMAIPDGATKISTFLFTNFNECKPLINNTSFGE